MKEQVALQHVVRRQGNQMFFFYDGALEAVDGLLTLPLDRPEWIERAWRSGYRQTPEGVTLNSLPEVFDEARKQNSKTVESTTSTEEEVVEDSDARRQPETGNRVRTSKPASSTSAKPSRTSGSSSRSVNDGKEEAKGK